MAFIFAYYFRDLVSVIIFITGLGFTVIPSALASFHFRIKPVAVVGSMLAGLLYVFILILAGQLIPELSIASIVVAAIFLFVIQLFVKNKEK
jgi:hypothetical protein